jgi:tetratricopeptide (TPR) repeat protein
MLLFAAGSRADEIVVDGQSLHRVQVVGYADGALEIHTSGGETDRYPLRDVEYILLDSITGVADFNQAEELVVKREWAQAVERYERAVRASRGSWASMMRVRLLMAAQANGDLERAVRVWLEVAVEDPKTAADLLPDAESATRDPASRRTLKRLEKALEGPGESDVRRLVTLLYYDFLRAMADAGAPAAAHDVAKLRMPAAHMTARTLSIQLAALRAELAAKRYDDALVALDALIVDAPEPHLPDVLLLKARALLGTAQNERELLQAAMPAMRIVVHFPRSPAVGEGLLVAAEAHERTGRVTEAQRLLRECLRRGDVPDLVREEARLSLAKLSAQES